MTQAEIAKSLGVSQATVSYVLKGEGKASPELCQRIMQKAREAGYSIRRRQPRKTGLAVLLDKHLYKSVLCDRLMIGIQEEASRRGVALSHQIYGVPSFSFESLKAASAGVIVAGISPDEADLTPLLDGAFPCVFLNRPALQAPCDTVMSDNAGGIRAVVRHLWQLGHRRLGFFGIRSFTVNRAERYAAYYMALAELGAPKPLDAWVTIPERHEYTMHDVDVLAGQALAGWMELGERPTAVLCSVDCEALGLVRAAQARGLAVPRDLSVIGFDNNPEHCCQSSPQLDSVSQAIEEMGGLAVEMLQTRIENPSLPPRHWRVPARLVRRETSAEPGR